MTHQTTDPAPGYVWDHLLLLRTVFPNNTSLAQALSAHGPVPAPSALSQWRVRGKISDAWLPTVILAAMQTPALNGALPVLAVPVTGVGPGQGNPDEAGPEDARPVCVSGAVAP